MFAKLPEQIKENAPAVACPEGTDARILEAADKLTNGGILGVILVGEENAVENFRQTALLHIEKCQIMNPESYEKRWTLWWRRW